ncbi:FAD/NAD(P)-binding domain-containing protein [Lactarius hatsudake]|nr:FAD/NAD(P)-binding domain-containing protein [Lactarius hatsudake]
MSSHHPPEHAQILIVGGGPSGSYAAASLALEGFHVARESLIPSVRHHLRFIGAEEKVASHGFFKKPGAAMKFNKYKKEAYTDFIALGHDNNAWNVTRSEFDKILLDHAGSTGAHVFQSTRVMSLAFSGKRPTSALWTHGPSSQSGTITFDYLVDASGRAGLMSNRYLKNRRFNSSLKNVAMWAYWRNTDVYARGTTAEGSPYFEALSDESGWAWFIPLGGNLTSVGIVRDQTAFNKSAQAHKSRSSQSSFSLSPVSPALDLAPGVRQLLGPDGVMVRGESESDTVRTASDYSYSASYYAGGNFRIVGDAGAFIDPFFSSGIHLAMTSGLSAAASIAASIRGDCPESEAAEWHSQRVGVSYTRFLIVVLSAYKQMRAQSKDVLCDIGEDNFDKAFSFLRPVIQGNADLGPRLSEIEVQNALDFCAGLFTPINADAVKALRKHFESIDPGARLSPSSVPEKTLVEETITEAKQDAQRVSHPGRKRTLLPPLEIGSASEETEAEMRRVLEKINARRVIHREHSGLHSLEEEALGAGYRVRLQRGRLGLVHVEVSE